jgi:hypothetical protein
MEAVLSRNEARRLGLAGVSAALLLASATPALAHRDGCHAAHSCPSDSGSYVCGDTGNYSECGYGPGEEEPETSSGGSSQSTAPQRFQPVAPPSDVTPPDEPQVGEVAARSGQVNVPVTAEAGSRITILDQAGATVTSARATGTAQTLSFPARDGAHTYTVTATDKANNTSVSGRFSITVDAAAPAAPAVKLSAASARGAFSDVVVVGERGARYAVRVARRGGATVADLNRDGVLADGEETVRLLAPNGDYDITVTLTDDAGNATAPVVAPLTVSIPAPSLQLERTSAANSAQMSVKLTGPALGKGTVQYTAEGQSPVDAEFTLDEGGTGTLTTKLADARWLASSTVVDFQQRTTTSRTPDLLVDTVAPVIGASFDDQRAGESTIAVRFDVEPDTVVTLTGLPEGERRFDRAGRQEIVTQADDGEYDLVLTATDKAGNSSVQALTVTITHPLTLGEGITAVVMLALLGAGSWFGGRALWRRRGLVSSQLWQWRAKKVARQLTAARTAALAQHDRNVTAYRAAVAEHERAHGRWESQTTQLREVLREAQQYNGIEAAGDLPVKARTGERLYVRGDGGSLVEMRKRNGQDVPTPVEQGIIWITDQRVLFDNGSKKREWAWDKLTEARHIGTDMTLMQVTNRQKISGIGYPGAGAAQVRRRLELAQAAFADRRPAMVDAAQSALMRHQQAPPVAPAAPPPAPVAPILPSADDLRERARKQRVTVPAQRTPADAEAPISTNVDVR